MNRGENITRIADGLADKSTCNQQKAPLPGISFTQTSMSASLMTSSVLSAVATAQSLQGKARPPALTLDATKTSVSAAKRSKSDVVYNLGDTDLDLEESIPVVLDCATAEELSVATNGDKLIVSHVEAMFRKRVGCEANREYTCIVPSFEKKRGRRGHLATVKGNEGNSNLVSHALKWHPELSEKLRVAATKNGKNTAELFTIVNIEVERLSNAGGKQQTLEETFKKPRRSSVELSTVTLNRIDMVVWGLHHGTSFSSMSCPLWMRMHERVGVSALAFNNRKKISVRDIPLMFRIIVWNIIESLKKNKVTQRTRSRENDSEEKVQRFRKICSKPVLSSFFSYR